MSRGAEELQRRFFDAMQSEEGLSDSKMLALIDAELRKERERCAERAIDWVNRNCESGNPDTLRAAILDCKEV